MYESFFGLTSRPFVAAPLAESYFPGEAIEQARQTLVRTIERAEGPGLIIGPSGVGKTLLCRVLAERFQETFRVALLSSPRMVTRKSLLQSILFELGLPYREMEEGELRLVLLDHLQPNARCPNGMLLLVDEAHLLSLRLLEEIRLITNLVRDGQPRVRLVLAGGTKLDERFTSPKLDSFNQRIAARCYLEAFNREDTLEYIRTRIASTGGQAHQLFTPDALEAIYRASDGIPRLINQVCDHALVMAFSGGRKQIDSSGIEEAWANLQQLPGPWQFNSPKVHEAAAIEFGELDEHNSPSSATVPEPALEVDWAAETLEHSQPTLDLPSDSIDEELLSAEQPTEVELETPAEEATPEPSFEAANPFGDDFEEEEVVIGSHIVRELELLAGRPVVSSSEGRELASRFAKVAPSTVDPGVSEAAQTDSPVDEDGDVAAVKSEFAPQQRQDEGGVVAEQDAFGEELDEPSEHEHTLREQDLREQEQDLREQEMFSQMFEYTVFEPNRAPDLALEALCEVNLAIDDLQAEGLGNGSLEEPTVRLADHHARQVDDRDLIIIEEGDASGDDDFPLQGGQSERVEYQRLFSQLRQV